MADLKFSRSSGNPPSTTTISTIAVQSGNARIVIALLQSREWFELKVVEVTPALTKLGVNLEEAEELEKAHEEVLLKIQSKQSPVEELLRQADQLVASQKTKAEVYAAMADSLAQAWRDINSLLQKRKDILRLCVKYHSDASVCLERTRALELACRGAPLPIEVPAIKELLARLTEVKRAMLESLMTTLQDGRALLNILKEIAAEGTLDSRPGQIKIEADCAISQVERWLEDLHDRRRFLELSWQERKTELEQCLALALLTTDLRMLEEILEDRKESLKRSCDQLGDSDPSAQLLLHEHNKLLPEAKDLQEQGLKILRATEQLAATGHFAGEEAIAQAYHLLNISSEYLEAIETRDNMLNKSITFFKSAHTALTKLDQLEVQLATTESQALSPQLAALHNTVSKSIDEITASPLQEGYSILDSVPGAEGVKRTVQDIENRKLMLSMRCTAHREENIRASHLLNNFLEKHNEISSWLISTTEAFVQGHQDMGSVFAMAKDFLQLHHKRLSDLEVKGTEINALLSTVPSLLVLLDEESKKDVQTKAEDLSVHWSSLKEILEKRTELASLYVKFHKLAVDLANQLDSLENKINHESPTENAVKQAEEEWVQSQQLFLQISNCANNFKQDSQKVSEPYLSVERACLCVDTLLQHFTTRKLTLAANWKDWESGLARQKESQIQWEQNMADTTRTVDWVTKLDAQLYPVLSEDATTAKVTAQEVEDKLNTILPEIKRAQAEIQMRMKTAEELLTKGQVEDSGGCVQLQDLQQRFQSIVTEYQILLEMLISFFKNLSELERTVEGLENQYGLTHMPETLVEVERALREHDASRQGLLELFKFTHSESQQIITKIKQQEPEAAGEKDIATVRRLLEEKRTTWERAWTDRKLNLEQHHQLCQFDSDLVHIHNNLDDLGNQLTAVKGQYGESLSTAKATSLAFLYFEKTIQLLEQRIETFVTAGEAMLSGNHASSPHIQQELKSLRNRWDQFSKQVVDTRHLIDISVDYFTLVEEAEEWFREGSRLLVTIARHSSSVRTPEEASGLLHEIEVFLKPGEAKQDERINKISELAARLFGSAQPTQVYQVQSDNREMLDSFNQISRDLRILVDALQNQQSEVMEMEMDKFEKPPVLHITRTDSIPSSAGIHQIEIMDQEALPLPPSDLVRLRKSPSPPPKKAKYLDEVPEPQAPFFSVPLTDVTIEEGGKFTFECRVIGIPVPEITWLKDGMSIESNPDYQTNYDQGICTLNIEETFTEDSATFTCRAHNPAGSAETSATLSVKENEGEIPPVFVHPLSDVTVKEDTGFELKCLVEGNPLPIVQWHKDNICIDNNSDYNITYNNGEAILKFDAIKVLDQADYSCKATNRLGSETTSAKVTVEYKETTEAPVFITQLSNIMARAGEKIKLECEVKGNPEPQLTWMHNGKPIKETRDIKVSYEKGVGMLIITEAFLKDAGAYSIKAVNNGGETTSICHVTVKGRLPTETSDSELASDIEPMKPSVQLPLKDTAVFEGKKVRLDCVIVGQPEPEVIWYHEDQPVKESTDFQLLFHGDRCSLIIQEAYLEDAGQYKVVAINSAGEASSACRLTVQVVGGLSEAQTRHPLPSAVEPEVKASQPRFTTLLVDALTTEGETVELVCKVDGEPTPSVIWCLNNNDVVQSERVKFNQDSEGNCKLLITSVRPEDKGVYTARATNSAGEGKCFAHLIVKPSINIESTSVMPDVLHENKCTMPSFTELFADRTISQGQDTKFECIVIGKPMPKVRWLFNDEPVSGKDFLVSTSGSRQVLTIPNVSKSHAGKISCIAENETGKSSCVATLTVSDSMIDSLLPELDNINLSETSVYELKRQVFMQTTSHSQLITKQGDSEPKVQVHGTTTRVEQASQKIGDNPVVQLESHKTSEYHNVDGVEEKVDKEVKSSTGSVDIGALVHVKEPFRRKTIPPRFIAPLMGKIVDQFADVTIEGIIESFPQADITWTKNGQNLPTQPNLSTSWELNKVCLMLKNIKVEDAGRYTCIASNPVGSAQCTADIVVKKSVFPPVIGRRLQSSTEVVGKRVVLEAEITGTPEPTVTWFKDGQQIAASSSMFRVRNQGDSYALVIDSAGHAHSGQYTVRATNWGGEAKSTADLLIVEPEIQLTTDRMEYNLPTTLTLSDLPLTSISSTAPTVLSKNITVTETVKSDKKISIHVEHSTNSFDEALQLLPKKDISTVELSEYKPLLPVSVLSEPPTSSTETYEIQQKLEAEQSNIEESSITKKSALDFFKNIIKENEEDSKPVKQSEGVTNKSFNLPEKSDVPTTQQSTQMSVFEEKSNIGETKSSFQQSFIESSHIVSEVNKEYSQFSTIQSSGGIQIHPEPPPEMGYIPKPTCTTPKVDMADRVKRLEESRRTLTDIEIPSGGVQIFPTSFKKDFSQSQTSSHDFSTFQNLIKEEVTEKTTVLQDIPRKDDVDLVPKPTPQTQLKPTNFEPQPNLSIKESLITPSVAEKPEMISKPVAVEEIIVPKRVEDTGRGDWTVQSIFKPQLPKPATSSPLSDIIPKTETPQVEPLKMDVYKFEPVKENNKVEPFSQISEVSEFSKISETFSVDKSWNNQEKQKCLEFPHAPIIRPCSPMYVKTERRHSEEIENIGKSWSSKAPFNAVNSKQTISPRPSAEGVAMEKLWSSSNSVERVRPQSAFLPSERSSSPMPSAEGVAMEKLWTQRLSTVKRTWPPPQPISEKPTAPWVSNAPNDLPPETETSVKTELKGNFQSVETVDSLQKDNAFSSSKEIVQNKSFVKPSYQSSLPTESVKPLEPSIIQSPQTDTAHTSELVLDYSSMERTLESDSLKDSCSIQTMPQPFSLSHAVSPFLPVTLGSSIPKPSSFVPVISKTSEQKITKFEESAPKFQDFGSYSVQTKRTESETFERKSTFKEFVSTPINKSDFPPVSTVKISENISSTPKVMYVAEAHALHSSNISQNQCMSSEFSNVIQTSSQESTVVEENILKPSVAKKLFEEPKVQPVPPPIKRPLPPKNLPPPPSAILAQEKKTHDIVLEPGPPPEMGYAKPPPLERRQSYVESIEQDLEKDLGKAPSRHLVGAVRIIPPPLKKEKPIQYSSSLESKNDTKEFGVRQTQSLRLKSSEPFPNLEPFPFKPDLPTPKPAKCPPPPKPSKFVRGSFTESDYESDYESKKISARWSPWESDNEDYRNVSYRKVKPPSTTSRPVRPHSTIGQPSIATQFKENIPAAAPILPSSSIFTGTSKEYKSKEITIEKSYSKSLVSQEFQHTQQSTVVSKSDSVEQVETQSSKQKPDSPKHKPDSPKSKQKYTRPVSIPPESGYMADTDEPRTLNKQTKAALKLDDSGTTTEYSSQMIKETQHTIERKFPLPIERKVPVLINKGPVKKETISQQKLGQIHKKEEPVLEPFPYKPEPLRPTKRHVGPPPPSPSKFIKGDFRESDYESDYEAKILPVWRPTEPDNESRSFKPVRPILTPVTGKSQNAIKTPTPPTEFDEPPQFSGPPRPKFQPIDRPKSPARIREVKSENLKVIRPKPVSAQTSPIETIVATPAIKHEPDFILKPGSPPKMDYAPPPPSYNISGATQQVETSNVMNFAESTASTKRVVSVQQTTRVIQFGEQDKKRQIWNEKEERKIQSAPTPTKFIPGNARESDYESDFESKKIESKWSSQSGSVSTMEVQAEQKRLQRVEEMRKRFGETTTQIPPPLQPGEPPQYLVSSPRIPPAASYAASKHMNEMTHTFKSKAQQFVSDIMTDVKTSGQNGVTQDKGLLKKSGESDEPQAYREESRLSEYGTKHIDPDTGLIYFKYDFGYEFGIVLPGETKPGEKKTFTPSKREEGSIDFPVIHEKTPTKKTSQLKSVKWEPTSESEMSDIEGESSRRRIISGLQRQPHILIPRRTPSPHSLTPSVQSISPYLPPGQESAVSPGSSWLGGQSPLPGHHSTPVVVNSATSFEQPRKPPFFITPLRDIACMKGQTARFECIVQSEPSPNILWTKDGRIIEETQTHKIEYRNGVCRLSLHQVMPYDAGSYTCTATNCLGTAESTASLQVPGERRPLFKK